MKWFQVRTTVDFRMDIDIVVYTCTLSYTDIHGALQTHFCRQVFEGGWTEDAMEATITRGAYNKFRSILEEHWRLFDCCEDRYKATIRYGFADTIHKNTRETYIE